MNLITATVVHYKRVGNVKKWIDGIRSQTVPCTLMVWDNSGDYPAGSGEDILVRSTWNFHCLPWVLMGGMIKTDYHFHQDNDKALKDPEMFEKMLGSSAKYPDAVFGWNGRIFMPDIDWEKPYSFPGKGWTGKQDAACDMINTSMLFMPSGLINHLRINPFLGSAWNLTEEEYKYGDDILLSRRWAHKRVTEYMEDGTELLDEYERDGAALSKQPRHMAVRDELVRRLFK